MTGVEAARTSRPVVASGQHSKARIAYQFVKSRIADGSYTPGFRLVLGQIATELDVSVVPVREAIRLLEAEGLVTFERNVGAQVAMLETTEYRYTMETLALVEGAATAMSAPLMTMDDLARALAINDEMISCLDDFVPHRFTQLNLDFHAVLFERCPNPHILELVHRGWNRLQVLRDSTFSFVPGRAYESVKEHARILELIAAGAASLDIEIAARDHRLNTLDALLQHENSERQLS
ncbi:MAG TPA: GntR family transcriptional regulator [Galbitalea sp.]